MADDDRIEDVGDSGGEGALLREQVDRLTAELEQSEAAHRGLRESLPLAVFFKDVDGHFIHVNEALCERVGRSEEEIIGRK